MFRVYIGFGKSVFALAAPLARSSRMSGNLYSYWIFKTTTNDRARIGDALPFGRFRFSFVT